MVFSVTTNGRKFTVSWKLPEKLVKNANGVEESSVLGSCFLLEYSFYGSKLDVKMTKKEPSLSMPRTVVAKYNLREQTMVRSSDKDQCGPVSLSLVRENYSGSIFGSR